MSTLIDIDVWRGDNYPPQAWQFPVGVTLGGSTFELTAFVVDVELFALSSDAGELIVDSDARQVLWPVTELQSLLIPYGRIAEYKLRRVLVGTRQVVAFGSLIGRGGNVTDV